VNKVREGTSIERRVGELLMMTRLPRGLGGRGVGYASCAWVAGKEAIEVQF
jgi:hypothetical protein